MRLVQLLSELRDRLRRALSDGVGPPSAPTESTEPDEFAELLEAIGSTASDDSAEAAVRTQLALRDATIAELREMLTRLRGIGDRLARTEQERIRLVDRIAALEALRAAEAEEALCAAERSQEALERLELKLSEREGVLARERERHAATREKLAEQKRIAAERWHELTHLRSETRRLETALDAVDEVPPALPSANPGRRADAQPG